MTQAPKPKQIPLCKGGKRGIGICLGQLEQLDQLEIILILEYN